MNFWSVNHQHVIIRLSERTDEDDRPPPPPPPHQRPQIVNYAASMVLTVPACQIPGISYITPL